MPAKRRTPLPWILGSASLALLVLAWLLLEGSGSPEGFEEGPALEAFGPDGGTRPGVGAYRGGADGRGRAQPAERVVRQPPPRRGPDRIALAVRDGETGEPIPGFQLNLVPWADGDPMDRLEEAVPQPVRRKDGIIAVDSEPGRYDVVVLAPGYRPGVLRDVRVPAVDGNPLPLSLDRGPGIAGKVFDDDGVLRGGVPVFLEVAQLYEPDAAPPTIRRVTTAIDGSFSFAPLPSGEYAVCLLEPDNRIDRVAGIRVFEGTSRIDVRLANRHALALRVEGHDGRPLDDAHAELRSDEHFASADTNAAGVARLENLPDGRYRLVLSHPRYEPLEDEVELIGGMGQHVLNQRFVQLKDG